MTTFPSQPTRQLLLGSAWPMRIRFNQQQPQQQPQQPPSYRHNDENPLLSLQEYFETLLALNSDNTTELLLTNPQPASVSNCEFLTAHLALLLTHLSQLHCELLPVCNARTCPTMRATTDWQYLCSTHESSRVIWSPQKGQKNLQSPPPSRPKNCSASDYTLHTLTHTQQLLVHSSPEALAPTLPSLYRRVWRIVLHAHFHHAKEFALHEQKTKTALRFLKLVHQYKLMSKEQLVPHIHLHHSHSHAHQQQHQSKQSDASRKPSGSSDAAASSAASSAAGSSRSSKSSAPSPTASLPSNDDLASSFTAAQTVSSMQHSNKETESASAFHFTPLPSPVAASPAASPHSAAASPSASAALAPQG